jgi:hypothetical protein
MDKGDPMNVKTWSSVLAATGIVMTLAGVSQGQQPAPDSEASRIQRGFQIAPVPLHLHGHNRDLVGLGSYIVNAQAACNDCHTNPSFAPGGDPYQGQPKHVNTAGYLAGGQHFGPFISPNITPDKNGLPAGLTWPGFRHVIRTGHDPDPAAGGRLLQVMPWPTYQDMTDRDLQAVYEYLRSIPSIATP